MDKVKLIFGTHNTIPHGESESLFEEAYQKAFKPFLTAVYNAPEIHSTLYYSGPLLDWLERNHPEFPTVLAEMMAKKNLEILGGGYWEPILPLIPGPDRVGQIEMMTTYLRKRFGKRSRGCWITGQIWEPHLASSLKSGGIDYLFLTERAFASEPNFRPDRPVLAEDQGKTVTVFPLLTDLSERFLKVPPEHILESLRNFAFQNDGEVVVSLVIPGVSLGGDGTHQICYEEKWLERFFAALIANRDWIETVTPARYLRNAKLPRQKAYIPGTSYNALMEWVNGKSATTRTGIPAGEGSPGAMELVPGNSPARPDAFYRDFLSKYRESGLLYAKMMYINILTNQVRGDKYRKKAAKEELWKGQSHYAYWHGPTGGLYNTRLRHSAYAALIEAEKTTRERGIFKSAITAVDFDMDGEKEYLYHGPSYNAYVHTVGGALIELDYLTVNRNYLSSMARYPETYHPSATREQGYDPYPRHAFLDHVLDPGVDVDAFERMTFRKKGGFPSTRYDVVEVSRDRFKVTLAARRPINGGGDALEIRKTYVFKRGSIDVAYRLVNLTPRTLDFAWGSEINLALGEAGSLRSVYREGEDGNQAEALDPDRGGETDIGGWFVHDGIKDVLFQFQLSEPATLWRFPVAADFRMGLDLRRYYQSSCFMPRWVASIPPLEALEYKIVLKLSRIKK